MNKFILFVACFYSLGVIIGIGLCGYYLVWHGIISDHTVSENPNK